MRLSDKRLLWGNTHCNEFIRNLINVSAQVDKKQRVSCFWNWQDL